MNFSGVRLDMSFKEAKELDEIIKRDNAMPIKLYRYTCRKEDGSEFEPTKLCPVCDSAIIGDYNFCPRCGQRLDMDNIAL